jgi:hypothetical protein
MSLLDLARRSPGLLMLLSLAACSSVGMLDPEATGGGAGGVAGGAGSRGVAGSSGLGATGAGVGGSLGLGGTDGGVTGNPGCGPFPGRDAATADACAGTPARLPRRVRFTSATTAPDGRIYLLGADPDFGGCSPTPLHVYDPADDSYRALASAPLRLHGGIAFAGGKLVAVTRDVYLYDPARDSWEVRGQAPGDVGSSRALVSGPNDLVYVFGGLTTNGAVSGSAQTYDPTADVWTGLPNLPDAGANVTAARVGGRLYVVSTSAPGTLSVFDPAARTWSRLTTPRDHRYGAAADDGNGRLLLIGGDGQGVPTDAVDSFDPASSAWTPRAPLPIPLFATVAARACGDRVFVFGGEGVSTAFTDVVQAYGPGDVWTTSP